MKKVQFNIVSKLKYLDAEFIYLKSDKGLQYFIKRKIGNQNISYPTLEEYNYLINKIESASSVLLEQEVVELDRVYDEKGKLKVSLVPKLLCKVKDKVVAVTLATALAMSNGAAFAAQLPVDITSEYIDSPTAIEELCKENNWDYDIVSNQYIRVNSNAERKYYNSAEEFSLDKYGEPSKSPKQCADLLYERVVNGEISIDYAVSIFQGLLKLQEMMPDANMAILYYNLSRLSVNEMSNEAYDEYLMGKGVDNPKFARANYDYEDGAVYVRASSLQADGSTIMCHEVIGHASSTILEEDFICTSELVTPKISPIGELDGVKFEGKMLEEARASLLERVANGNYDEWCGGQKYDTYGPFNILADFCLKICDMSPVDFINKGTLGVIEGLTRIGIKDPLGYISRMDDARNASLYGGIATDGLTTIFTDLAREVINVTNEPEKVRQILLAYPKEDLSYGNGVFNIANVIHNLNNLDMNRSSNQRSEEQKRNNDDIEY